MLPLSSDERRWLLRLARQTLEARLQRRRPPEPPLEEWEHSAALRQRAGVFVSLHKWGELRGCVGCVESPLPLCRTVMETAQAAAAKDPRFPPVEYAELAEIDLEISVLSRPRPAQLHEIRIGVHGLMVTHGRARGLLLPQVAVERQWDPQRFLEETCRKAGLPPDAWRSGALLEAFEADVFGEKTVELSRAGRGLL